MEDVSGLVAEAAAGDERAWADLVRRYSGLVWAVARAHRLTDADASDVAQTAWLRLVEHLHRLEDPSRVGAWLATTTRRECLRVLRRSARERSAGGEEALTQAGGVGASDPVRAVSDAERDAVLWAALGSLDERCRLLLRALAADSPPSYADVSALLDMPIGSIGPTRARCLERLRRAVTARGITADAIGSV